jgi:hypothetical protein
MGLALAPSSARRFTNTLRRAREPPQKLGLLRLPRASAYALRECAARRLLSDDLLPEERRAAKGKAEIWGYFSVFVYYANWLHNLLIASSMGG